MARGGARPGAGRPKSTVLPEEKRASRVLKAGKTGTKTFKTALEFAMAVINDAEADMDAKTRLAIAAMPFQSPKLEAVAPGGGKKAEKQAAADQVAGKFGTPTAPKLVVDNRK